MIMKRFSFLLLLLFTAFGLFAQNYAGRWAKVEEAHRKDLPKTVLQELKAIKRTALQEKNVGQLIRATAMEATMQHAISPDSAQRVLEEMQQRLRQTKNPVERALWQNVLGQWLAEHRAYEDTAQQRRARQLIEASLADMSLLSRTSATRYAPLFESGAESRAVFQDDLLSAFMLSTERLSQKQRRMLLEQAVRTYEEQKRSRAALHMALELSDRLPRNEQRPYLEQLRSRYLSLKDNAETYARLIDLYTSTDSAFVLAKDGLTRYGRKAAAELYNYVQRREAPSFKLTWQHSQIKGERVPFYPATTYHALLRYNNLRKIELRLHRLTSIDAQDNRLYGYYKNVISDRTELEGLLRTLPHQEVARVARVFSKGEAHKQLRDSLPLQFPSAGVYILEVLADGRREHLSLAFATTAFPIDAVLRSASVAERRRHWVDLRTGAPLVAPEDAIYWPQALPEEEVNFGPLVHEEPEHKVVCRLFTDRAIYRPGQQVEISGIVFAQKGEHTLAEKGWKGTILVKNVGEDDLSTLDTLQVESDEMGAFATRYAIPKHLRVRMLMLSTAEKGQRTFVYVEEYKRPTFEVKIDPLSENAELSEELVLRGQVVAHNGVPLPEVQVRTLVDGTPKWGVRSGLNIEQRDTLRTDAEGRFVLKVNTTKVAKYGKAYQLEISAEALADNGELQHTSYNHLFYASKTPWNDGVETKEFLHITPNKLQTEATLRVSSPCHLLITLVGDKGGVLEERVVEVEDSLSLQYAWEERMGDGAQLLAAFVKEGRLYKASAQLRRPEPDKRLLLSWRTFRSTLTPGQLEEWTLRVTRPDGSPVEANVMARLYDGALDAFVRREWEFPLTFPRLMPQGWWNIYAAHLPNLFYSKDVMSIASPRWQWTRWNASMLDYSYDAPMPYRMQMVGGVSLSSDTRLAESEEHKVMLRGRSTLKTQKNDRPLPLLSTLSLRKNFQETAFFFPRLRTNTKGEVTLRFSLPEQLTAWNFSVLATDKDMNHGLLHERIVARKIFTAQTTLPRFVREGDQVTIPCRVHNTDSLSVQGRLRCTLMDAKNGKQVARFDDKFDLAAGRNQTFNFTYAVPDGQNELIVKFVAESKQYSDGEEHRLPVLSRFVTLTHAQPFTVKAGEDYAQKVQIAREQLLEQLETGVHPHIVVDTCKDARGEVKKVLPELLKVQGQSSTDWANTLYALELLKLLKAEMPLSAEEWEEKRRTAEEKLQELQMKNGEWGWYRGMYGSTWITSDIVQTLARLRYLTGNIRYDYLIQSAMDYLGGEMASEVLRMKEPNREPYMRDWFFRYLYSCRLMGKPFSSSALYLLEQISKHRKMLTMYGKSGIATILAETQYKEEARLALQSLVEHTVYSPEMGRYFDTERAFEGWSSYRIPTQTFAMEALSTLKKEMDKVGELPVHQIVDEMRLWLLQSKRTQQWKSSRATTNAAFALLAHPDTANAGLAWGSVTAQYRLPATKVLNKGKELRIGRRLQLQQGDVWRDAKDEEVLQVGQRVRWVYDLDATRDFDHLVLHSTRPACFETLRPLSGMAWTGAIPHYRWVRDDKNEYFIEHLSKGKHTMTDEMIVTLQGRYDAGIATLEAVFAPEFRGNSNSLILNVER